MPLDDTFAPLDSGFMADELTPADLITAAAEPSAVTVDGQSVQQRSVDELIAADRYAASKAAASAVSTETGKKASAFRFLRFGKAQPPGAV